MVKTRLHHIFINLIAFLGFKLLSAQPYYFKHYQVENGLSNNTVFCSAQDKYGFLWFGTKDGLNRFDGYHFKVFQPGNNKQNIKLNADYIFSLHPMPDGSMWVGSFSGLYRYYPEKEKFEVIIDTLNNISNIHFDKQGLMWFLAGEKACRYNIRTHSLKQFPVELFFNATSITLAADSSIWIGTTDGFIEKFDEPSQKFIGYDIFTHSIKPATRRIEKIKPGPENSIFVGTKSQGIKQFHPDKKDYSDLLNYTPEKTAVYIRDILQASENEFWFASESGIYILNTLHNSFTNIKKKFNDPYSINDNAVYCLYIDNEGSMWAGTYFGGVNYYSKQSGIFKKYFPENTKRSISGSAVRDICGDNSGHIWMATEDNGITSLNKTTGIITQFLPNGKNDGISNTNIHGLLAEGNTLWIGTYNHGIDVMDINKGKVLRKFRAGTGINDIKSNFSLCFLKTANDEIYTGTSAGLFKYNKIEKNFERIPVVGEKVFIKCLWEDHNNILWIGTGEKGLYWYNLSTKKYGRLSEKFEKENIFTNKTINDLYEDDENNLWVATEGAGLCKLNLYAGNATWYTTQKGLPSNFIFKILQDDHKVFWITTSKGLLSFDRSVENIKVYTKANGLLNDQFNYHSGYKDTDGKLFLGSVKGLISFDPFHLSNDTISSSVYITGLQVYDQEIVTGSSDSILHRSVSFTDKITLSYQQSTISIDFAALSYISPETTPYNYRMIGLSDEWTSIKTNRKAYFTNLKPGEYVFEVKVDNAAAKGNIRSLKIIITPPFWLTRWAISMYILISLLLAYLLFKEYHKRQQNKREKEIYKGKMVFFTNVAHEIRTPLTLIKGPVENLKEKEDNLPDFKEDLDCLYRNTNRLMELATQILDFRQTEIKRYSLDFDKVNLTEILQETFFNFKILAKKKNLSYEFITSSLKIETYADKDALQKVFSNLISNAIKYSFAQVKVEINHPDLKLNHVRITFKNDGFIIPDDQKEKIFAPFYRIKTTNNQKGAGIGLSLARSLTELHKGKLYLDTSDKLINNFILMIPYKTHEKKQA